MKTLRTLSLAVMALLAGSARAETHLDNVVVSAPDACTKCCYNPCIDYHHFGLRKACCCECGSYETVLNVTDPCTCCVVAVPVCLPCCCKDTPEGCGRPGLFGSRVIRYDYCCGVSVVIRISKCGDISVTYHGA